MFTLVVSEALPVTIFYSILIGYKRLLKLGRLFRQQVALGDKVELLGAKLLSHLHEVARHAVLSCELGGVHIMVYLLVLEQLLINLLFTIKAVAGPQQRPDARIVGVCVLDAAGLQHLLDELRVGVDRLVGGAIAVEVAIAAALVEAAHILLTEG